MDYQSIINGITFNSIIHLMEECIEDGYVIRTLCTKKTSC